MGDEPERDDGSDESYAQSLAAPLLLPPLAGTMDSMEGNSHCRSYPSPNLPGNGEVDGSSLNIGMDVIHQLHHHHHHQQQQQQQQQHQHQHHHHLGFNNWDASADQEMQEDMATFLHNLPAQETACCPTPDLLHLFHFSNHPVAFAPASASAPPVGFLGGEVDQVLPLSDTTAFTSSSVLCDPLFQFSVVPPAQQPSLLKELFQSVPPSVGYSNTAVNFPFSRGVSSFLFGGAIGDHHPETACGAAAAAAAAGGGYHFNGDATQQQFDNRVLAFAGEMENYMGSEDKITKHSTTERQKRQHFKDKYSALASLVPNLTKPDRASVLGDAIDYIKELVRQVNELQFLVEKKRCGRKKSKEDGDEVGSCDVKPHLGDPDQSYSGSLRSSWLQRKSKDTEVDVRIVDDEVTIRLVQRKKVNCLLFVSKVLDELQLDILHVAGGHVGDYYSFLFNTKICEGSYVYASAIANRLMEVVDRQYASISPTRTSCY